MGCKPVMYDHTTVLSVPPKAMTADSMGMGEKRFLHAHLSVCHAGHAEGGLVQGALPQSLVQLLMELLHGQPGITLCSRQLVMRPAEHHTAPTPGLRQRNREGLKGVNADNVCCNIN